MTTKEGANQGRSYYLKCDTAHSCIEWVTSLRQAVKVAVKRDRDHNIYLRVKNRIGEAYNHDLFQIAMASVIALSFICNVVEVQVDQNPEDSDGLSLFDRIDLAFTIVFVLELLVNLFVHWFSDFWRDSWNVFDLCVVSVSVIALFIKNMGSATALRTLRLFRALRVLRLFRRLKECRKIIESLSQSLVPVANAFVIILLIMSVYAILGVQLFREDADGAFGSFSKAMFTMFAASTMDGWQELIVIPMIPEGDLILLQHRAGECHARRLFRDLLHHCRLDPSPGRHCRSPRQLHHSRQRSRSGRRASQVFQDRCR